MKTKMKVAQIGKSGGNFELVERESQRLSESSKLKVSAGDFCSAFQRLIRNRNSRDAFLVLK